MSDIEQKARELLAEQYDDTPGWSGARVKAAILRGDVPVSQQPAVRAIVAALEAAREDAEKWRKCNATHDIGDGERIECHVIVGVNVYDGKDWCGFEQPTPDEFFKTLDAIDQARGKGVQS